MPSHKRAQLADLQAIHLLSDLLSRYYFTFPLVFDNIRRGCPKAIQCIIVRYS